MKPHFILVITAVLFQSLAVTASPTDPLPSWNAGSTKNAIVTFVAEVTTPGGVDFVPVPERVAVFDNDGTLWGEQPVYFQLLFAIDRIRALAPDNPQWKTQQPFQAVLENDMKGLLATGKKGLAQILMSSHAGVTIDEFAAIVTDWVSSTSSMTKRVSRWASINT